MHLISPNRAVMEFVSILTTLVCLSLSVKFSLSEIFSLESAQNTNLTGSQIECNNSIQQTSETQRIIKEVDELYALAIANIKKNLANTPNMNGVKLLQQLIDANATGFLEGYRSCPRNANANGIYTMDIFGSEPFPVLCDAKTAGPGWTVISQRINGNLSFYKNWQTFKQGFGSLHDDFFIGLDKLHLITKSQPHELYIHLEDFEGQTRYAIYDEFLIENENRFYAMSKLGSYSGDAGDSLTYHKNMKFSTYDKDNDESSDTCAILLSGAWWHKSSSYSGLFGLYLGERYGNILPDRGVYWHHWRGSYYSYKTMKMMVRPKCSCPQ